MIHKEFAELVGIAQARQYNLLSKKGSDYTQGLDRLSNFKLVAEEIGTTPEQVLWVYLAKHLFALRRYVREGRVESEPLQDRIDDAINYLHLLEGLIRDQADVLFSPSPAPVWVVPDAGGRRVS